MNTQFTSLTLGALALGLCAPFAAAQETSKKFPVTGSVSSGVLTRPAQDATAQTIAPPARATQLVGTKIADKAGETLWMIKDLVVCANGDVVALVERDDDMLCGIPLNVLEVRLARSDLPVASARSSDEEPPMAKTAEVQQFRLKGDRALFDEAPTCQDAKLVDAAWLTRCVDHFAMLNAETKRPNEAGKALGAAVESRLNTDRQPTTVSAFLGKDVKASSGEVIGSIKDLAVNLSTSRVSYAIVSVGGLLGMGATLHPVSFEELALADGSVSRLMTADSLAKLPVLDMARLSADPVVALSSASGSAAERGTEISTR